MIINYLSRENLSGQYILYRYKIYYNYLNKCINYIRKWRIFKYKHENDDVQK